MHLLNEIALDAFESRKAELKGDGKAGRWFSPLELHVLPKLGKVPVAEIDQRDIRDTLAPIWHDKADTARKAMNRLSICLRHAAALGLEVDLQATDKARALLGKQRHTAENVPAMPWQDVPAFYQKPDGRQRTELALRLLILTAVRSYPLRHLHVDQIEGDVWTIPAEAMKGRMGATSDFRVPLSIEAQARHRRGPQVRPRRLPVPRRPQGRHFRHDHDRTSWTGAAWSSARTGSAHPSATGRRRRRTRRARWPKPALGTSPAARSSGPIGGRIFWSSGGR